MRIAIITCVFPPYHGGIGNVAWHHASELARRGHEVVVFTPYHKERIATDTSFKVEYLSSYVRFGNASFIPQLWWKLVGFDIVHLHYPFFGAAFSVTLKKYISSTPLVVTYHMDVVGTGLKKIFFSLYNHFIVPFVIHSADVVIVSTLDYIKNSCIRNEYHRFQNKFHVIPFGVDVSRFTPNERPKDWLEKYGIDTKEHVILFVGGLDAPHYFKGLECLLHSLAKLTARYRFKLLVVGQDGDLKEYYKQLSYELGMSERVVFCGSVSDTDLARHYQLCDFFILVSIDASEAFGLVYLEAASCEKPSIGSSLPGVREVIEDGITGFVVKPRDREALSNSIEKFFLNPQLVRKFGLAAREKVLKNHRWSEMIARYEALYSEIMKLH